VENPELSGFILDDRKHPGRVPPGRGMVTLVAARGIADDHIDAPEADVVRVLMGHAERYLPGLASACITTVVSRFRYGMPMPTARALALRPEFLARPLGPVDYAGDWYTMRPSSEGAVRSAEIVAERVLAATRAPLVVPGG
nr:FAD-dependent oxidoreductase [Actinomycetota bacterium]